jgi:hypothetical protein
LLLPVHRGLVRPLTLLISWRKGCRLWTSLRHTVFTTLRMLSSSLYQVILIGLYLPLYVKWKILPITVTNRLSEQNEGFVRNVPAFLD